MAFSFLRFSPGGASDPKLRTDENASNEHTGIVKIDLGAEGLNAVASGSLPVREPGAPSFATNQVPVTSSITQVVAARATRRSVMFVQAGSVEVFIGGAAVTTATGIPLVATRGATYTFNTTAAISARTASGTTTIAYIEEFD